MYCGIHNIRKIKMYKKWHKSWRAEVELFCCKFLIPLSDIISLEADYDKYVYYNLKITIK